MNPEHLYNTTATRYIWTASDPDTYGSSPTYTEGDSFSCFFDRDAGSRTITNQKDTPEGTHYINFSSSVTLTVKDEVEIASQRYEIIYVDNPANRNEFNEAILRIRE
jgi:hypothetical protein